jgi:hypothetical protein
MVALSMVKSVRRPLIENQGKVNLIFMGPYDALLACFVTALQVAPSELDVAMGLFDRGEFVAAGAKFAEVARTGPPEERRSAATRAASAYKRAFEAGELPGAAEHLCSALALEVTAKLREQLMALRAPFGPCAPPAVAGSVPTAAPTDLLPVARQQVLILLLGICGPVEPQVPVKCPTTSEPAGPTPGPTLQLPGARRGPSRPGLAWSGLSVLGVSAAAAAIPIAIGAAQAVTAANVPETLLAEAKAAGRPFTTTELTEIDAAHERLHRGLLGVGVGAGVGAALMVAGAVMIAVGWRSRGPRRLTPNAGLRGVVIQF